MAKNSNVEKGQRITVSYENREFDVIVIDPNGLGVDQPSLGFGFRMMEQHSGLPSNTISQWLQGDPNNDIQVLKVPSSNTYKVIQITGGDNNQYLVLEVSDWVTLAGDVLKKSGKVRKPTQEKLIDFLTWFATKGLYAEAYVQLKGVYTARDSRSLSKWMMARLEGVVRRNKYTDFLKEQGCTEWYEYANWTNYIYERLFGKTAKEMKQLWSVVEGTKQIARNYISKEEGLRAVAYCENQVVELHIEDLKESHDDAIDYTRRKFKNTLSLLT